jgi:peptide deformylase
VNHVQIPKNYVPSALKKSMVILENKVIEAVVDAEINKVIMIITNNENILRAPCEDVTEDEVADLINRLDFELKESNRLGRSGIGLAAPQIGISKKVAIIRFSGVDINLVNCRIEKGFDQAKFLQEGCLSFPGRVEDTLRYQEVYIANNLIYPHSFIATGIIAVICQHEIDHLNGKLFMDSAVSKIKLVSAITNVKQAPNDKCLCKSGKKFKKCCGRIK